MIMSGDDNVIYKFMFTYHDDDDDGGTSRKTWWNCAGLFLKSTRQRYDPRSESFRFSKFSIHNMKILINWIINSVIKKLKSTGHRYQPRSESFSFSVKRDIIIIISMISGHGSLILDHDHYHFHHLHTIASLGFCAV